MEITSILESVIIGSAILLILLILLQSRGATLGAGFGASGELYTKRRGLEKSMFVVTAVFAFIFLSSIVTILVV